MKPYARTAQRVADDIVTAATGIGDVKHAAAARVAAWALPEARKIAGRHPLHLRDDVLGAVTLTVVEALDSGRLVGCSSPAGMLLTEMRLTAQKFTYNSAAVHIPLRVAERYYTTMRRFETVTAAVSAIKMGLEPDMSVAAFIAAHHALSPAASSDALDHIASENSDITRAENVILVRQLLETLTEVEASVLCLAHGISDPVLDAAREACGYAVGEELGDRGIVTVLHTLHVTMSRATVQRHRAKALESLRNTLAEKLAA